MYIYSVLAWISRAETNAGVAVVESAFSHMLVGDPEIVFLVGSITMLTLRRQYRARIL